jgi:hypothetical protein
LGDNVTAPTPSKPTIAKTTIFRLSPSFFPLSLVPASLCTCDKRGEVRVEKQRPEEVEIELEGYRVQPHDGVPAVLTKRNDRSGAFVVKRDEEPKVEAIDVLPITVTGSDLIARHGKRSAALIP